MSWTVCYSLETGALQQRNVGNELPAQGRGRGVNALRSLREGRKPGSCGHTGAVGLRATAAGLGRGADRGGRRVYKGRPGGGRQASVWGCYASQLYTTLRMNSWSGRRKTEDGERT
eukprot:EG_transcript_20311